MQTATDVVIIGAGPSGLACGLTLTRESNLSCIVLEKDDTIGGLSRTVCYKDYRADIGGHRFFTKNVEVQKMWESVLGDEFLTRPRKSRIYYRNTFFSYPLRLAEVPRRLGLLECLHAGLCYLYRRFLPVKPESSFRDWVINQFGDAMYERFFHHYTRKVWGIEPDEIDKEWAIQRIRKLSLLKAVLNAAGFGAKGKPTSLIEEFRYPRLGPGQMYSEMARAIEDGGNTVCTGAKVTKLDLSTAEGVSVSYCDSSGKETTVVAKHVVSSMPIDELVQVITPAAPEDAGRAAKALRYRAFVCVNLIFDCPVVCDDNWIYLNSNDVTAGRLQLYHNWSKAMTPEGYGCVGFEYFCDPGDEFWDHSDEKLHEICLKDLAQIEFLKALSPVDFFVSRFPKAYPCYFGDYRENLETVKVYLQGFDNILPIGRAGQFRYNNMDHSIETGILAARKIHGKKDYDLWAVNEDAEYMEETRKQAT